MNNEKMLSDQELMELTGGASFINIEKLVPNFFWPIVTVKYGVNPYPGNIPMLLYGIYPINK